LPWNANRYLTGFGLPLRLTAGATTKKIFLYDHSKGYFLL
jgi:hypothetical protein